MSRHRGRQRAARASPLLHVAHRGRPKRGAGRRQELSRLKPSSGYDTSLFEAIAAVEDESFWYRARARLIVSTIRTNFPAARRLLEVGCGSGGVLASLRQALPALELVGTDLYDEGLDIARRRLPDVELLQADAQSLPFVEEFDLVGAFDVLEHVPDDRALLASASRALRPGGGLIVLVPQHAWLWSDADRVAHHQRRYGRNDLVAKVREAGFDVVATTSFVTTLLPLMLLSRVAQRVLRKPYDPVAELVPPFGLNTLLSRVLDGERRLIERGVSLPAGGSLLVVGRKPA